MAEVLWHDSPEFEKYGRLDFLYKRINGFDMFYRDQGNGIPLVFLHGFPLTGDIWDPQIKALSAKARVIVPDLRGFGKSGVTPGTYTMELYAQDLKKLLETIGINKAVLAGISMGGYIAFAFYRLFPSSVRALVLLDTKAGADSEEGKKGRITLAQRARSGEMDKIADEWAGRLFAPSTIKTRPEIVRTVRDGVLNTSPEAIANASLGMMERPDSTPLLGGIVCPVLIMVGEEDMLAPVEEAKAMAAKIKDARVEVIKGAGHLTCLEAPEAVNKGMLKFLSEL